MLRTIDPTVPATAERIVEIQLAAYAIEANLIGFDGIPQLSETAQAVRQLGHMHWIGAFNADLLVGLIAWEHNEQGAEIDRLAVDPQAARQGFGRQLVRAVPAQGTVTVSTGEANIPAVTLYLGEGFKQIGSIEIAPNVRVSEFQRTR